MTVQPLAEVALVPESPSDIDEREVSIEVLRVGLWSVGRLAIAFWSFVGALVVAALAFVCAVLTSTGVISKVEHFVRDLTGVKSFHILSNTVLASLALLVFMAVVGAIVATVLAAACYNALTTLVGGVRFKGIEHQS